MITYIASEIGAGKTCYAAKLAQKAVRAGRVVYSNTKIHNTKKISVNDLLDGRASEGALIILDETGNEFNSRNFKTTSLKLIEYFKLSRHYKNDIIMISQTFGDSDKQIRELAQSVLFIRVIFKGLISMIVNVRGKIGVDMQGSICMQYKIGSLGALILLPRWFGFYNTYSAPERKIIEQGFWDKCPPNCRSLGCRIKKIHVIEKSVLVRSIYYNFMLFRYRYFSYLGQL